MSRVIVNAQTGEVTVDEEFELEETPPTPADPNPFLYAAALLSISAGEVGGIGVNSRFSAALYADTGLYYLFFAQPQDDVNYLAKAYDEGAQVDVIEKSTDYIAIQARDGNGDPFDPAEISVEIIRVS